VSSTRDATPTFDGSMRGLFQSEMANMLRMSEVNELLVGTDAVLIFDESGFAKKGEVSACVARHWNGRLGKFDNLEFTYQNTLMIKW
jgi:SRSO17 transposase